MSWITEITTAISSALTGVGSALANFLTSTFTAVFLKTGESGAVTGVSNFGIFAFILMGISLACGLTYYCVNMIRRKM